jgi:dimethylargininase
MVLPMSPPIALTREVSPSLGLCELSYLDREPIDVALATSQHRVYVDCLRDLGARTVVLPAQPELPDAVFVEDTAVVVDEVAVVTFPGAESRRPEVLSIADALVRYRPLEFMPGPETLDGGDVLRIGRTFYVGLTPRSTEGGIAWLRRTLAPFGYDVRAVGVHGCLHLKSGCTYIGRDTILANRSWVDIDRIEGVEVVEVVEPWAANTLTIGDTVLVSATFPATRARLESRGFSVRALDISEIQKAEGGLTCMSIVLSAE